jgi:glycosyltransferase involved in cell wall biosynthesis
MVVVIDATNIRGGGGVTHLVELLKELDPTIFGYSKVYVCATKKTNEQIEERPWLIKYNNNYFEKGTIRRFFWQIFFLPNFLNDCDCDLLFIPGGTYFGNWKPFVTMSQNLLPFEWEELKRYGFSKMLIKMLVLNFTQSYTFNKANGLIFLTNYAQEVVKKKLHKKIEYTIIPHGINKRFENEPKKQFSIDKYSNRNPFKILYISSIDVYKHQDKVIEAVSILYKEGFPVLLELIGPSHPKPLKIMNNLIRKVDPKNEFIVYSGTLPYKSLDEKYRMSDLFLFASSCETFGQIVTEAMSAGLPIACSNKSSLPDVLGNCGIYFNPEDSSDIALALRTLILDPDMREQIALCGYKRSKGYTWNKCANETFLFLSKCTMNFKQASFK